MGNIKDSNGLVESIYISHLRT